MSETLIDTKIDDRVYFETNFCRECNRKLNQERNKKLGTCQYCRGEEKKKVSYYDGLLGLGEWSDVLSIGEFR